MSLGLEELRIAWENIHDDVVVMSCQGLMTKHKRIEVGEDIWKMRTWSSSGTEIDVVKLH